MAERKPSIRVLFACTGLGVINRGIESFFRDAFDGLRRTEGLELCLLKGAGMSAPGEQVAWNVPRTSRLAKFLGAVGGRNGYVIEQWSSFPSVLRQIRKFRPDVVFYSDANLGFLLFWLRRQINVPFTLLFSNGGPVHPPFIRTDYVHQVAPCYYQEALRAGEPSGKHFLVPYGINIIPVPTQVDKTFRAALRRKLGLPVDREVILSVGWIRKFHKRMDYVIEETARLPNPRPFLQLLGAMDERSREVILLGKRLLGPDNFSAASVSFEKVFDYYRVADCFVLASLNEGFGRVYLEALMHGLPVIAHRNAVTEYVLGRAGFLRDLRRPGTLAVFLREALAHSTGPEVMRSRWQSVRDRFSWEVLAGSYRAMFSSASCRGAQVFEPVLQSAG